MASPDCARDSFWVSVFSVKALFRDLCIARRNLAPDFESLAALGKLGIRGEPPPASAVGGWH